MEEQVTDLPRLQPWMFYGTLVGHGTISRHIGSGHNIGMAREGFLQHESFIDGFFDNFRSKDGIFLHVCSKA